MIELNGKQYTTKELHSMLGSGRIGFELYKKLIQKRNERMAQVPEKIIKVKKGAKNANGTQSEL